LRKLTFVLVVACLAAVVAACGGSSSNSQETPGPPSADVTITASGLKFDHKTISVPANTAIKITLVNKDATPHNLSVYTDKSAKEKIFSGDLVNARETKTYTFQSPGPGTYFFHCDVHPDMNGSFVVS
jgi:plastocyanin